MKNITTEEAAFEVVRKHDEALQYVPDNLKTLELCLALNLPHKKAK